MTSSLAALRRTPQVAPERFLSWQPGSWIQYSEDTGAKDPAKALSTRSFDSTVARQKQQERCAVCFSLQAFGESRIGGKLLCYRSLGVDVDLVVSAAERLRAVTSEEIDRRKEEYLTRHLLPFPLPPHWVIETRHGFHVIVRIQPVLDTNLLAEAEETNRRLASAMRGDEQAVQLTQVMRVPGTLQFTVSEDPFLCRLLLDRAGSVNPYDLRAVQGFLDAWELSHPTERGSQPLHTGEQREQDPGQYNARAVSVVGKILCRLPEDLWETAGWGGLKEWNGRNAILLAEQELRTVFESIARRERAKRGGAGARPNGAARAPSPIRSGMESDGGTAAPAQTGSDDPASETGFAPPSPPPSHVEH